MKVVVAVIVLLFVLVGVGYFIVGDDDVDVNVGTVAKVAVSILPNGIVDSGEIACTEDARVCDDGSVVVRGGPDCEFAACPSEVVCLEESRDVDSCIEIYQPVCGSVRVDCISEPCDNVRETFSNSCDACRNDRVYSYTEGEC